VGTIGFVPARGTSCLDIEIARQHFHWAGTEVKSHVVRYSLCGDLPVHRLTVHHFGPVEDATIDVARFLLFIGPQASGKSTLSKLIYYFLHVRDEVTRFIYEAAEGPESRQLDRMLKKRLRTRFVEFFGPTPQPRDVRIEYRYTENCQLRVALDQAEHKYVDARFSAKAWGRIRDLISDVRAQLGGKNARTTFPSALGRLASEQRQSSVMEYVRKECNDLFGYSKEIFFIPAGRSMLSTLSDQLQYIHPHLLDYPMRQFVDTVNTSRAFFGRRLDEIVRDKKALSSSRLRLDAIRRAQEYIRKILKGEYVYDREGGKLFVSPGVFTKMNYASSGQQEVVWILLSLFLILLENSCTLVVIEEPESHLYPDAQKAIVEFIAFVFNVLGCDFIVTTHSPYVMGFVNDLLYAEELGKGVSSRALRSVISDDFWIDADEVAGYFVDQGKACSMMDEDVPALKWDLLDHASDEINDLFNKMVDIEAASHER